VHVPSVEGLEFAYALHRLPPGRFPFARWRWELWHGASLVAAGWRITRADATRALRVHAAEFGHTLFGLAVPDRTRVAAHGHLRAGGSERIEIGPIAYVLRPLALEPRPAVPGVAVQ
jgi:hypothetical protein